MSFSFRIGLFVCRFCFFIFVVCCCVPRNRVGALNTELHLGFTFFLRLISSHLIAFAFLFYFFSLSSFRHNVLVLSFYSLRSSSSVPPYHIRPIRRKCFVSSFRHFIQFLASTLKAQCGQHPYTTLTGITLPDRYFDVCHGRNSDIAATIGLFFTTISLSEPTHESLHRATRDGHTWLFSERREFMEKNMSSPFIRNILPVAGCATKKTCYSFYWFSSPQSLLISSDFQRAHPTTL